MPKRKEITNIEDFPISQKTISALRRAGLTTSADFINYSANDIKKIDGIGPVLWLELKEYLTGKKIKLKKREPAPKKTPKWDPKTREVLLMLQRGQVQRYAVEMKYAGMLVERYGVETCMRASLPSHVDSVQYFFSGGQIAGWVDSYFEKFAVMRLVEKEPAPPQVVEPEVVTYQLKPWEPKTKAPKTLADFLKDRKNGL